jgi:hypothetical protein
MDWEELGRLGVPPPDLWLEESSSRVWLKRLLIKSRRETAPTELPSEPNAGELWGYIPEGCGVDRLSSGPDSRLSESLSEELALEFESKLSESEPEDESGE